MKLVIATLLLPIIGSAQIDRPVTPEDLADQRGAAQAKQRDDLKAIGSAENYLRNLPDAGYGVNPQKQSSLIHLEIIKCLTRGDFTRKETEIYSTAAATAGRIAQDLEAKSKNPVAFVENASTAELRQQLEEKERRIAELKAKPGLTELERVELEGLENLQKQVRETLLLIERARLIAGDLSKITLAAERMRERERFFQIKAKEAETGTSVYNVQCAANLMILNAIAEGESRQKEIGHWSLLEGPAFPSTASPKRSGGPLTPTPAEIENERLKDEIKDFKKTLSDPVELQQRIERLKALTSQAGSN